MGRGAWSGGRWADLCGWVERPSEGLVEECDESRCGHDESGSSDGRTDKGCLRPLVGRKRAMVRRVPALQRGQTVMSAPVSSSMRTLADRLGGLGGRGAERSSKQRGSRTFLLRLEKRP